MFISGGQAGFINEAKTGVITPFYFITGAGELFAYGLLFFVLSSNHQLILTNNIIAVTDKI